MFNSLQYIKYLIDTLPFIKKYMGKVVVIKYGGAAMVNNELKKKVINDILFLFFFGIKPVLIHGGGPIINRWLNKLKIEPQFRNGIRLTDENTMEIVQMVLSGKINKDLVSLLNINGNYSIGLSGVDGNLINASPLFQDSKNLVGKVDNINADLLMMLLDSGYIPVIASVGVNTNGQLYNINADTVAGHIARVLNAEKLILLTDTPGIMNNISDPNTVIKNITVAQVFELKEKNIISGGMIPKVECCIHALQSNVKEAHIIDGRLEHSLLLELFTINRVGSMLTP
uniref:Acetylglutamate kinase n=1 Tax=Eucheuma denticulatum TaxID=305493 RepID=A0A8E7UF26_9FLOR|nr:acetylglutamate kinase [Eucheuma denticulatum]